MTPTKLVSLLPLFGIIFVGCQTTNQSEIVFRGITIPKRLHLGNGHQVRDLFIEDVPGSKSYWLGPWVKVQKDSGLGEFYIITGYSRFYVETKSVIESDYRFYGPFQGNPKDVFPNLTP